MNNSLFIVFLTTGLCLEVDQIHWGRDSPCLIHILLVSPGNPDSPFSCAGCSLCLSTLHGFFSHWVCSACASWLAKLGTHTPRSNHQPMKGKSLCLYACCLLLYGTLLRCGHCLSSLRSGTESPLPSAISFLIKHLLLAFLPSLFYFSSLPGDTLQIHACTQILVSDSVWGNLNKDKWTPVSPPICWSES